MNQNVPKVGIVVATFILIFVMSALWALLSHSPSLNLLQIWTDPYYRHVTEFSFYQALLSTLLSVGLAIPVAHSLSYRQFPGRSLLLKLFASTLVLPVLVGVFGLLAIYGNSGLLADGLKALGAELPFSIYGLNGILLAHVFFNLPYAARLLLQSLESIPPEQHKLCAHLGMSRWNKFLWVEWPRLKAQLPQVSGLVFMLCFTSFATVMALGGGPKSTTIELAIYQAIKFDFDLQTGALLAMWQMLLCGVLAISIQKLSKPVSVSAGSMKPISKYTDSVSAKIWDGLWIGGVLLLVLPPLGMVVLSGLNNKILTTLSDERFWNALSASLQVAGISSLLALLLGTAILSTSRIWRLKRQAFKADKIELAGTIILVTPGLVISTGLFLLLRDIADVFAMAFWIVVAVNCLMALPYVIKTLSLPMFQLVQQYQYLSASLGIKGWNHLRLMEWRALRKSFAYAFSISFMMSMGDLSAIALFGSQEFRTLPLYLFQLLGSYQMEAAAVVSLCLLLLSVLSFTLIELLFKPRKTHDHS
ncbi:thiamine/thiamine pyrophosphate ABC transporter permease ThiP [Vibrio nigripulchritudo]|uniref:thiamine/thiamine pyrophosphate ABC transporter permease ThiP n=1 Tax=Vibrio nigripulchritudo TaxID=28173 RepID=UPI00190E0585|nr:thiamine/thiamine pyrophosphate ABC transporter permease ThiP [Vibrio nigripulchritudo]BCL68481.1 thiamine/thiamine pyrophosphate ABC transporter permease ThiP [Vibrio nigripulchritudo]BDU29810.1 thiamine/thiamine pyrophosphate ABC transporter permease ThiP [Vibrio nigripulchritudo]